MPRLKAGRAADVDPAPAQWIGSSHQKSVGEGEQGVKRSSSKEAPPARREGLIVESMRGETLVYDERRDEAHRIGGRAGAVFDLCDGRRSVAEIAARIGESEAVVDEVLGQLAAPDLLAAAPAQASRLSRREGPRRGAYARASVA